ncbi:hypothetical protein PG985_008311 [Apiospora marii]|uniref:Clr5 domain-containing protein n=1 Tax=Apiospora marii TaxID=335849 RepID=A0ABR1SRL8_9PEZI
MSTPASFKWVDQKQERATRIPAAEWTNRETRLRELHSQMTLTELMEVMKSEGFVATRKQYDHQFRKWGLQKYGIAKSIEKEPGGSCPVENQATAMLDGDTIVAPDTSEKRPRSIPRVELSGSRLSDSLLPPSKKVKMTDEDGVPRSPRLDIHVAHHLNQPFGQTHSHSSEGADANPVVVDLSPSSTVESCFVPIVLDTASEPTEKSCILPIYLDTASEPSDMTATSTGAQAISGDETISRAEQNSLFEDISDEELSRPYILSPLALSCARSAETPSQRTLVRELLLTRLDILQFESISPSETMLAHMLLAQMFALDGHFALSEKHLNTPLKLTVVRRSVDTSFEVLSYLHYKHPRPGSDTQTCDQGYEAHLISQYLPSVTCSDFVDFAYDQRRTSSWLRNDSVSWDHPRAAVSEYVRSCIAWCSTAILKDSPSRFPCFDTGLQAKGSSAPYSITWQDTVALYNYFNKMFLDGEPGRFKWMSWRERTREKLGISSAELLVVCCDMIAHYGTVHGGYANRKFSNCNILVLELGSLREDLTELEKQPDEELVTQFLRCLYLRTNPLTLVSKFREPGQGILESSTTTISGSEHRPSIVHTEESPFSTTTDGPLTHRSTRGEVMREMVAEEPMIASSCRSSNTSYKRMKDAAVSIFNRRFNSMGSRFSLSSRELRQSLAASTDRMSDIMRDSLRISIPPGLDQVQQAPVELQEWRGASDPKTVTERQDETSITKAEEVIWI